ncbi:hypothetical protein [Agrobacterium tumefaciens]|uniref:hypothetical protein n=1 Tax=Agrobacterium tumefaciens TaxID=358 RepID=UPI00285D6065|nr:hypothetical protein [Agrobacterium tumefaciens]MDR6587402.1 hypothetical protein [Agrobacterium tumefaciens]
MEQPVTHYLPNPVTVAGQTPKTRDEIAIRDAVRGRLAVVENAIIDFVAEKTAEGFCLDDINSLYAVELPILFGYRIDGGRVRGQYDGQIIER